MKPLIAERLTLRPFILADAPFIVRLLNEPSFLQHIGDKGVRTLEQAEAYLGQGPMASYASHGHGLWLVESGATGAPMGMCGLIKRDALPEVDLGYAFMPEFRGRGLAREAAAACLAFGRTEWGLRGVMAIVSPGNASSIRLLRALGFEATGPMTLGESHEVEAYRVVLA